MDRELRVQAPGVGLEVERGDIPLVHEVLTPWGGAWLGDGKSETFEAWGPAQEVLLIALKSDFILSGDTRRMPNRHVCTTGCSELKIKTDLCKQ